jgi:hypothetical protein
MIFTGSKRPITKKLLQRIDLRSLFNKTERQSLVLKAIGELENLGIISNQREVFWSSLDEFLVEYSLYTNHSSRTQYAMDVLFPDSAAFGNLSTL